jgi:hypothetical protein
MPTVSIRWASYDYSILRPVISGLFNRYCGQTITPPFPRGHQTERPVSGGNGDVCPLSPALVRATVELVASKGAEPCISDSPAMGSFEHILNNSGFTHEAPLPGKLVRKFFPRY